MCRTIIPKSNSMEPGASDSSVCSCGDTPCKYRDFGIKALTMLATMAMDRAIPIQAAITSLGKIYGISLVWDNLDAGFIGTDKAPNTKPFNFFLGVKRRKNGKVEIRVTTHDIDFKVVRI